MPNHLSVLTLVLLNKFSTALFNESTPLHHENPCCLARIFFFKTILCLSAVFSWLYRAENLCYQFIHGQKLLPQFRRLSACYPSGDVLFSCSKGVDYGCFFEKTAARFACRTTFSVLTLVLLNKFSTALFNESTPLHHENPCCLARIFFFKTILCLSAVFSWLYRAENLCYQFIHGQKLLPQFRRLSACYPSGDVLFSCSKGVDYGCFFEKTAARFACRTTFSVLTTSKERCKRLHLQISCAADIDGGCTHRVLFA